LIGFQKKNSIEIFNLTVSKSVNNLQMS